MLFFLSPIDRRGKCEIRGKGAVLHKFSSQCEWDCVAELCSCTLKVHATYQSNMH